MWHTLKQFYNSAQWNHIRNIVVAERSQKTGNITCEYCGNTISSFGDVEIDHIKELTLDNVNDVNISLNTDNLKIACHSCHNKKHGRFCSTERKVYIVYGAPFSGKNTYVKQNMDYSRLGSIGISSKGERRGIGLYNVKLILSQYQNVMMNTEYAEQQFIQEIIIYDKLPESEE